VRRSLLLLVLLAGSVLLLDLWTKRWASDHLAYREPIEVLGDSGTQRIDTLVQQKGGRPPGWRERGRFRDGGPPPPRFFGPPGF